MLVVCANECLREAMFLVRLWSHRVKSSVRIYGTPLSWHESETTHTATTTTLLLLLLLLLILLLSLPTVRVQQNVRFFWASNMMSIYLSISHPKHYFEGIRFRNPSIAFMCVLRITIELMNKIISNINMARKQTDLTLVTMLLSYHNNGCWQPIVVQHWRRSSSDGYKMFGPQTVNPSHHEWDDSRLRCLSSEMTLFWDDYLLPQHTCHFFMDIDMYHCPPLTWIKCNLCLETAV